MSISAIEGSSPLEVTNRLNESATGTEYQYVHYPGDFEDFALKPLEPPRNRDVEGHREVDKQARMFLDMLYVVGGEEWDQIVAKARLSPEYIHPDQRDVIISRYQRYIDGWQKIDTNPLLELSQLGSIINLIRSMNPRLWKDHTTFPRNPYDADVQYQALIHAVKEYFAIPYTFGHELMANGIARTHETNMFQLRRRRVLEAFREKMRAAQSVN